MKKIKKGSSLISVVMVFAILFILATSIIAVTVSDYKLRIKNNQRVKNLYGSESGLEEVYAKLGTLIDKAIAKANEEVTKSNGESIKDNGRTLKYEEKNSLFRKTYKNFIEYNTVDTIENGDYLSKFHVKPVIEILTKKHEKVEFNDKDELNLEVKSTFKSKETERTIKTTFNISTPDYNKTEAYKSAKIPIRNCWTKSFVVGKDFINKSDLEVLGDIYVLSQGDNGSSGKGVLLDDHSSKLTVKGKLVSRKDIRLQGPSSQLKVESDKDTLEDLSKVYTETLSIDKESNNSSININGQVYAHNDLSLNAEKSQINITQGFYGINDIGTKENSSIDDQEAKNSSCIIVNTSDIGEGSSINIGHEAILMGTAYINVDKPYQTGESVGIKGNYRAYGVPLTNDTKFNENNIKFEYREPLQLATKFKDGKDLLYDEKGQYLEQYIEEYKAENINKGTGISLPDNTIHVGAIFNKGNFKLLGYKTEDVDKINQKKQSYNRAINEIKPVEEEIDFSKLNNKNETKVYTDGTEVIYLNNTGEDCVLFGLGAKEDTLNNLDKIDISNTDKSRGIIITRGDVYVIGEISEFKGTIIAGGNIIFEDKNPKKFVYDKAYIKKLIAANYPIFKDVFTGTSSLKEVVRWEVTKDGQENLTGGYVRQKLLRSRNWKIMK